MWKLIILLSVTFITICGNPLPTNYSQQDLGFRFIYVWYFLHKDFRPNRSMWFWEYIFINSKASVVASRFWFFITVVHKTFFTGEQGRIKLHETSPIVTRAAKQTNAISQTKLYKVWLSALYSCHSRNTIYSELALDKLVLAKSH